MEKNKIIYLAITIWLITFLLLITYTKSVQGQDFTEVVVTKVYDGDTITANIPNVIPILGEKIGIRISHIDTPEIRGRCDNESYQAIVARDHVRYLIGLNNNRVTLRNCIRGKYFRLVCDVWTTNNIADDLIHKNMAIPYEGETKTNPWCE